MERGPLRPLSRMTATRAPLPRPRSRSSRMVSPSVARTGRLVSMPARRTHTHTPHHTRERLLGGRAAPPCLQREGWLGDPRSLLPLRSCTPHNSALSYMHGVRSFLCVSFAARCMLSVVFIFRGHSSSRRGLALLRKPSSTFGPSRSLQSPDLSRRITIASCCVPHLHT